MDINITKDNYGSLFAHTTNSAFPLFQFEYRDTEDKGGPAWYFWLRGDNDPDIFEGKKFPYGYFKGACIAKSFILNPTGGIKIGEDVDIVKGENYLKV